jgi:hypothetical protein
MGNCCDSPFFGFHPPCTQMVSRFFFIYYIYKELKELKQLKELKDNT